MSESHIVADIRLAHSKGNVRVFRNNVGSAWQGEVIRLADGSILIKKPRIVHFGLCEGSGDLVGFQKIKVIEAMVGMDLALFVNLEVKTKYGRPTQEQLDFIALVNNMGGNAAVVRSVDEARVVLHGT